MNKKNDSKKVLSVQFTLDESDRVHFVNPSVDDIPIDLFCLVLKKIGEAEKEWNDSINKTKKE